jgi:disulfide bond formation protein DsbB
MSIEALQELNSILALLGIVTIGVTVIMAIDLFTKRALMPLVRTWGAFVVLLITIVASGMTLIYSEIFGILPCGFCWLERIMLYSQVILALVALYFKDTRMHPRNGIAFSGLGFLIAAYHHYIQMGGTQFIACPAGGSDCAKRFMFEYGFVTFPFLSAVLFALLIVIYIYMIRANSSQTVD